LRCHSGESCADPRRQYHLGVQQFRPRVADDGSLALSSFIRHKEKVRAEGFSTARDTLGNRQGLDRRRNSLDCNASGPVRWPFHGTFGLFTDELEPRIVTGERTSGEGLAQLHASIFNRIGGVLFCYRCYKPGPRLFAVPCRSHFIPSHYSPPFLARVEARVFIDKAWRTGG
jgi:hypothetical protein